MSKKQKTTSKKHKSPGKFIKTVAPPGLKHKSIPDWGLIKAQTDIDIERNTQDDPLCQPTSTKFWTMATVEGYGYECRVITRDTRVQDKDLYAALGYITDPGGDRVLIYVAYTKYRDPVSNDLVVRIEAARKATTIEKMVWIASERQ